MTNVVPLRMEIGVDHEDTADGPPPMMAATEPPIPQGMPASWPHILGFQRLGAKEDAEVLVAVVEWPGCARLWQQLTVWLASSERTIT